MDYKVHRFEIRMTRDKYKLEQFLNSFAGEAVVIIPNVAVRPFWIHQVDFLLIVEKTS